MLYATSLQAAATPLRWAVVLVRETSTTTGKPWELCWGRYGGEWEDGASIQQHVGRGVGTCSRPSMDGVVGVQYGKHGFPVSNKE